jgi:hypothetical protein
MAGHNEAVSHLVCGFLIPQRSFLVVVVVVLEVDEDPCNVVPLASIRRPAYSQRRPAFNTY